MRYVGLDLHAKRSTVAILEKGSDEPKTRTIRGSLKTVLDEVQRIQGPYEVCYEASTSYGVVHDVLSQTAARVAVAHPGKLRLIYRSTDKHDRADAKRLAKLLYLDMVPEVHVPSADVRGWRRLILHRQRLIQERTRTKNALRSLLRGLGIEGPQGLWTRKGIAWLAAVAFAQAGDALARDEHLERLRWLATAIRRVEHELDRIGRTHPGVVLLRTIPGVGIRTAEAVVAWIDQPQRFRRHKAVARYFGLVPCEDSSAGRQRFGHITRQGASVVRHLLNQSAWQAIRHAPQVKAFYDRVRRDDKNRRKIALVATMHYLVRVMHAMLRTGEPWRASAA